MLGVTIAAAESPAHATQPLEEFLAAARTKNFDAREQMATKDQRDWEKDAALGRLLPSFTARGTYTRNQFEIGFQLPGTTNRILITPHNQLDALLQLDVPIVDLAGYYRYQQAKKFAETTGEQVKLTGMDVERDVSRAYYSFLGASALLNAAKRNLDIAEENARYVTNRREAGVAMDLDLERANANVEQAKQNVADSELARSLAGRSLETLSRLTPTDATEFPEDDLHSEADLESWLQTRDTPTDRVQQKLREAALAGKKAAAFSLVPTLSANAQERLTNATGFTGRYGVYALQAVLSWRLDYATYASAEAQTAANQIQVVRNERARRGLEDTIFEAYRRVEAGIAKSRSSRAQAAAASKAVELANERYRAGASTQLDVTQAQRDAFQADANRIQADADLAYARILLRVAAGQPASNARGGGASPPPAAQPTTPPPPADSTR